MATVLSQLEGHSILLEVFSRENDFGEWIQQFESVAVLNNWDDITNLQWLRVCIAGKAHMALHRAKSVSYKQAKEEFFKPTSKSELYKSEL